MNNALNQMAFSDDQYPASSSQIQGYMSGHRLAVTYYSLQNGRSDRRSNIYDSPGLRSVIHSAFECWQQFEITLAGPWELQSNAQTKSQALTFVGRMYPGFIARKGDLILTALGDNQIGLFKVVSIETASWRQQRAYQFGAYLIKIMDQETANFLTAATIRTLVFDPEALKLGAGTNALLTETNYTYLQEMRRLRDVFCAQFYELFYNRELMTVLRPDGYYDPYVVRFVNNLADITVTRNRAVQLIIEIEDSYQKSLWARLEDPNCYDLGFLQAECIYRSRLPRQTDTFVTAIAGRGYLSLDIGCQPMPPIGTIVPAGQTILPYVFGANFYQGLTAEMGPFETLLYNTIVNRRLPDVEDFVLNYVRTWRSLTKAQLFYRIPLYVWLMDVACDNLARVTP